MKKQKTIFIKKVIIAFTSLILLITGSAFVTKDKNKSNAEYHYCFTVGKEMWNGANRKQGEERNRYVISNVAYYDCSIPNANADFNSCYMTKYAKARNSIGLDQIVGTPFLTREEAEEKRIEYIKEFEKQGFTLILMDNYAITCLN